MYIEAISMSSTHKSIQWIYLIFFVFMFYGFGKVYDSEHSQNNFKRLRKDYKVLL